MRQLPFPAAEIAVCGKVRLGTEASSRPRPILGLSSLYVNGLDIGWIYVTPSAIPRKCEYLKESVAILFRALWKLANSGGGLRWDEETGLGTGECCYCVTVVTSVTWEK
jgi:hypothetical protein